MKTIRLGAYDFDLFVQEDLRSEDNNNLLGRIRYEQQDIAIEYGQTQQSMAVTFLHEVLHGLHTNCNIKQKEKSIIVLAQALAQFLQDNFPHAWDEILATFDGVKDDLNGGETQKLENRLKEWQT